MSIELEWDGQAGGTLDEVSYKQPVLDSVMLTD
jgi:hypothetical protein